MTGDDSPATGEPVWTGVSGAGYEGYRVYVGDGSTQSGISANWTATPQVGNYATYYYGTANMATAYVTSAVTPNFVTYTPIYLGGGNYEGNAVVTKLTFEVVTAQAAKVAYVALYSTNIAFGTPGTKIEESAAISVATTGVKTHTVTDGQIILPAGWYWLAALTDANTAVFRAHDNLAPGTQIGSSSSAFALYNLYFEAGSSFPAFATVGTGSTANLDGIAVRVGF